MWWRPLQWFIWNCTCRFNTLKKYPGCKPKHPHYMTFVNFEFLAALLLLIPFIWDMTPYNWVSVSSILRQHSSLIFKGQGIILDRHLSWKWGHYIVMKHHKLFTQWHIIVSQKNGFLKYGICFCVNPTHNSNLKLQIVGVNVRRTCFIIS